MSAEKEKTLGECIDEVYELKAEKRALEEQAENLGKVISSKEELLLELMDKQDTAKATGKSASASVQESVVPTVEDWETFWAFIRKNNAFELLQRRVVAEAWRERAGTRRDKTIPGTVPYVKRKVSVRVA